jgi:flavin reductase (DIM6/NTAB) family NADH-FMN oxidoreductase RutF
MKQSLGARTILYPTPVLAIGTYDSTGKANMMAAAWAGICCSRPPCVSVSLRRATQTYHNLTERKAFTVNVPSEKYLRETDYFGLVSGKREDKTARAGLTAARSETVDAPYLEEFPLILECRLAHTFELGLHTQFVGEIMDVKADTSVLGEDGMPDIEKVQPFLFAPDSREYYGIGRRLGRAFHVGKELDATS